MGAGGPDVVAGRRPVSRNPIARFGRWLGWSEDQYLSAAGYLPLVAAFVAGVVLSYTSLVDLAGWLGFGRFERPFLPFAIDALVFGCYIAQARLAGVEGFGPHRLYIVVLLTVAGALTASGNAMHGLIVWKLVLLPLPWPILVAGALVPALAMVGVGHALSIVRAAARAAARQRAVTLLVTEPVSEASAAVQPARQRGVSDRAGNTSTVGQGGVQDDGHLTPRLTGARGSEAGQDDVQGAGQAARQKSVTKARTTAARSRQLRRAGTLVAQEPNISGAELGRRLRVSTATGQRLLRELADAAEPAPYSVLSGRGEEA
jgi:hypothetical protein